MWAAVRKFLNCANKFSGYRFRSDSMQFVASFDPFSCNSINRTFCLMKSSKVLGSFPMWNSYGWNSFRVYIVLTHLSELITVAERLQHLNTCEENPLVSAVIIETHFLTKFLFYYLRWRFFPKKLWAIWMSEWLWPIHQITW